MGIMDTWGAIEQPEVPQKRKRERKSKRTEYSREKPIQQDILNYLELRKIPHTRVNSGSFMVSGGGRKRKIAGAKAGTSDIIGCLPDGRYLAIEVKSPDGDVRATQCEFIAQIRACGGVAFVAYDVTDVMAVIEPILQTCGDEYKAWEGLSDALKEYYHAK